MAINEDYSDDFTLCVYGGFATCRGSVTCDTFLKISDLLGSLGFTTFEPNEEEDGVFICRK